VAQFKPDFVPVADLSGDDINFLIGIGRAQALLLDELQIALEAHNDDLALQLARQLTGLEQRVREESDCARPAHKRN
jgi:hypothetical protein